MTEKELDFELNAAAMPVNSIAWGENDFVIPADKAIEILKKQQAEIENITRVKDEWVRVFIPMREYCDKEKIGSLGQSFVGAFIDSHKALTQRVKELEKQVSKKGAAFEYIDNHNDELAKQLAKANERIAELETINLELSANVESCCELTEMDMGSAIERLFEIDNTESKELLNKFAMEKKIEFKNDLIKHLRNNYTWSHSVYELIDSFGEQLSKGG